MSLLSELKKASTLEAIAKRLEVYEQLIEASKPIFELKGKRLEEMVREQAYNLVGYDQLLQECKTIENFMTTKLEVTEATLHKHYLENSQRALGARDLAMYIKGDPQFSDVNQVVMEVAHIRRQLEAIVEALKSLGWSLSHIVKLRVASLEQTVL
jgi:hypothetical protein